MTNKEKMKYYVDLLNTWEKCLDSFFTHECPDAPPGAVRVLLEAHSDVIMTIGCLVNDLPNE